MTDENLIDTFHVIHLYETKDVESCINQDWTPFHFQQKWLCIILHVTLLQDTSVCISDYSIFSLSLLYTNKELNVHVHGQYTAKPRIEL